MESKRDLKKRQYAECQKLLNIQNEQTVKIKKLTKIIKKDCRNWTNEEKEFYEKNKVYIDTVKNKLFKIDLIKKRREEIEDDFDLLENKINKLIELIHSSNFIIIYTGAGISTPAQIPDYRGPKGVWTQLNAKRSLIATQDLALAVPTFTHMALVSLYKAGIIKHIVSQNCDGLHLRSGLPQDFLSEIHGNMYIEICKKCEKQHFRDFDVTEHTSFHHHKTNRFCIYCSKEFDHETPDFALIDTIVHFGEKGNHKFPLNWKTASDSALKADLIICLGSSLKVLKNYDCLWPKQDNFNKKKKINLVIINLQWTSKDKQSILKINSKCDQAMQLLMNKLKIKVETYDKEKDPLKKLFIPLNRNELDTCNRFQLFSESNKLIKNQDYKIVPGWFGKGLKITKK